VKGAGNTFLRGIETLLLEAGDLAAPCTLRESAGLRVDLDALPPVLESAPDVDRLYLRIQCEGLAVGDLWIDRPLDFPRGELALLILRRFGLDDRLDARESLHPGARLAQGGLQHLASRVPRLLQAAREIPDAVCERQRPRAERHVRHWQQVEAGRSPPVALHAECEPAATGLHGESPAVQCRDARQIPVLMYHSIAAEGPASLAQWRLNPCLLEEQLAYLQGEGYRSVTSRDLVTFLHAGTLLPGQPVLLTFDDGYLDFLETAWPLLQRYGFTADVFLVTDRVGGSADWDRSHGTPAPLMGWAEIAGLHRAGVNFGSHFATHRRCSHLTTHELVEEAARSRAAIEARLACPVTSMAIPFGAWDERLVTAVRWAGYEIGFTTADGTVSAGMQPLTLPRIEVIGGQSTFEFACRLERAVA
jgi:peptidoglycan/xylan/chitin deacetylase (PgdA/CDA1 family)